MLFDVVDLKIGNLIVDGAGHDQPTAATPALLSSVADMVTGITTLSPEVSGPTNQTPGNTSNSRADDANPEEAPPATSPSRDGAP